MRLVRVAGGWVDRDADLAQLGWEDLLTDARAVAAYTLEGRLYAINDAMYEVLGWPIEELERRGWIACLYPDPEEQAATYRIVDRLSKTSAPRRHGRTIRRSDGTDHVVDMLSMPFTLPDGRRAIFTTATDATRSNTPIGSGRGYRELVEDAPDILTRVDARTGRHLFVSRAVVPLTGYTPAEIYADPDLYKRLLLPEFRDRFEKAVRAVVRGEPQWLMLEYRRKDGGVVSLYQALYPIRDADGRVIAVEGVARDMTAVRALERQLQQTVTELRTRNEELSSLDRLKSQLLANVSHELRTPLVTIKGYNELIRRGSLGPVTARQRRALEIASGNTERLVELIESLLDFARLEEGRLTLRRSPLDARGAIRDALDSYADRIAEKGLQLNVDLGEAALGVEADRARLTQVMKVLLSNAEKFCESPGEIRVLARRDDGRVAIEVSDTGIGIPAAALPKIFDRFYQVDASMTRRFGGAGLGLALAREIVALHGGDIGVVSEEGRGSTFTVRLPAVEATEAAQAGPRTSGAGATTVAAPIGAADRPMVLLGAPAGQGPLLRQRLESEGLMALEAASSMEVIRRARRHRPDAVVLAIEEEMVDTIEALHADAQTVHIPVIAMVGDDQRESVLSLADYVVGPADWSQLADAVRRLLGREPEPARRPRVLVVDDEPEIVDFARFVLEREGYQVGAATTAAGATRELGRKDDPYDLVILDIALEGHDGVEICRQLKGQPDTARLPVLMVTAMTGEDVRHAAFTAGAEGFLTKPFGVDEFLRQVRLHVRSGGHGNDRTGSPPGHATAHPGSGRSGRPGDDPNRRRADAGTPPRRA